MTAAAAQRDVADATMGPLGPQLLTSLVAHLLVVVGLPLAMHAMWRPAVFVRPHTFELVRVMPPSAAVAPARPAAPAPAPAAKEPAPRKAAAKTPQPARTPAAQTRPAPAEPEEDLGELEALLGGISAPAVDYTAPSGFKYLWYLNTITRKVEQNWKPPLQSGDVYVEVTFTIFRNGGISDVAVTRSSGSSGLDNMAARAVKLAAPFGELPVGYGESRLEITYKLRPSRQ